jgi:site-specific recombinase XerD
MQPVYSELVGRVDDRSFDDAQVAAVAFLARYNGRTLDAYRQDLRGFFDWAGIVGLEVLTATRGHIELYRQHLEQRALAASTIDRRLSTLCGFYRFAHIDGRITAHPAQLVRRPKSIRAKGAVWTATNSASSCSSPSASTEPTRRWRCCWG